MQEVHWVARASGQIVQPHAVDIREAALRRLRGFRSSRFSTNWHEPVYPPADKANGLACGETASGSGKATLQDSRFRNIIVLELWF